MFRIIFNAVLSNKAKPGYGQVTIPFPIPDSEYDYTISLLETMDIGSPADKLGLSDIKDLINLTFCCRQATVIEDFSDLARVGKDHAMTMSGGAMTLDEYSQVDGRMVALDLLQNHSGTVTSYGVVYDNGMKLDAVVVLARPQYAGEAHQLAENLDQFDFVPRPSNPNADCAMTGLDAMIGQLPERVRERISREIRAEKEASRRLSVFRVTQDGRTDHLLAEDDAPEMLPPGEPVR